MNTGPAPASQPEGRRDALDAQEAAGYAALILAKETGLMLRTAFCGVCAAIALTACLGCTPKVQVEAPKEPITINMNIKIEHEIRVKVDKELDSAFDKNSDIF